MVGGLVGGGGVGGSSTGGGVGGSSTAGSVGGSSTAGSGSSGFCNLIAKDVVIVALSVGGNWQVHCRQLKMGRTRAASRRKLKALASDRGW